MTIMVKILFPSIIVKATKERETTVTAETLGEAIDKLIEKYGDPLRDLIFEKSGELNRFLKFYIKGSSVLKPTMETPLRDDDEVVILVVISGG
jgi:molybdopterin converting factor small subunit